ncbi:MAG: DUF5361 domain-containing protein [Gordonibacter sp.]|uniref:DUF5361 domain-containing protein n=1 Tax=Gordonibacter sp. TaxID=1968902 RepID=UPI002FC9CA40
MLNKIEYLLRHVAWQRTKDAARGINRPKPCPTPAEEAALRKKLERTDMADIARKLNIEGV